MQQHTKTIGWTIFFALVHLVGTAHAQMSGPRLWLVDDGGRTVYEVTMDGDVPVLDRSFPPVESARSSIAVDPFDGTMWGASETRSATPRGSVVNYGKDGSLIQVIPAEDFNAYLVEGVTVDPTDDTLWVVDDPNLEQKNMLGAVPMVHHINKDGSPHASIPSFPAPGLSPQSIAYDTSDDTLWVTDNLFPRGIYNIGKNGAVIGFIDTRGYARNPQGITVDPSGTLWFTARGTGMIYNISKSGDEIYSSFKSTDYDPDSLKAVGVAYDVISYWTQLGNVIADLQMILDVLALQTALSSDDDHDRDEILDAIKHITRSYNTDRSRKYWQDTDTPRSRIKKGKKVFERQERAMRKLIDVRNSTGLTDVSSAMDELLRITRELAEAAINKAEGLACALPSISTTCADVEAKIVEANLMLDEGVALKDVDPVAAIEPQYWGAWIAAQEAIQIANGI